MPARWLKGSKIMRIGGGTLSCGIRTATGGCWMRCIAIAAVLCAGTAIAADRTFAAPSADALIAALADCDGGSSSIEAPREPGGRMKVAVRGKSCDGRRFLKAIFSNLSAEDPVGSMYDIDLDIKLAKFAGFDGEALHNVELRLSGQGGEIHEFVLTAKLGAEAGLRGELRAGSRPVIYLEADDAGAFFRFIDVYRRMQGGRLQMSMDAPSSDHAPQDGIVNVRNFVVAGEPALNWSAGPPAKRHGRSRVEFSRLSFEFKPMQSSAIVSDGVISGPLLGATFSGKIDFAKSEVGLRGLVLPLNQLEPAGLLADPGAREGLFSLGYTIAGPLQAPVLSINPAIPLTPGVLRKLFEKPDGAGLSR
jgi:hypothetical protein